MWIIARDGRLINTDLVVSIDVEGIGITAVTECADVFDLFIADTDDELKAELRKIALAIAYGADVYEVGKGVVQYDFIQDYGEYGTMTNSGHMAVELDVKHEEQSTDV